MPHHRRLEEPDRYFLLSNRTQRGEFTLRPDRECCRIIRGCLARECRRKNVELVSYSFLSNHFHLVARFPEGNRLAFMRDFQGELSRRLNSYRGRSGTLFPKPYHAQALLDVETMLDQIGYTAANPVRHGLVADPGDWPGVVSFENHRDEAPLEGRWLDHNRWHNLQRRQEPPPRCEAMVEYTLDLHVPDRFPGETREERRKTMLEHIERARRRFVEEAGLDGRRRRKPTSRFQRVEWRRRESINEGWCDIRRACAGSEADAVAGYLDRRRRIDEAYREAAEAWRSGQEAAFPTGTYPPGQAQCVKDPHARAPPG